MCYIDSDFILYTMVLYFYEECVHILDKKCPLVWFLRLTCGSLRYWPKMREGRPAPKGQGGCGWLAHKNKVFMRRHF